MLNLGHEIKGEKVGGSSFSLYLDRYLPPRPELSCGWRKQKTTAEPKSSEVIDLTVEEFIEKVIELFFRSKSVCKSQLTPVHYNG